MELGQLRSFVAVAEVGSITGAAARVGLTQPAVTQQMKVLEREAGAALLDRTGGGVRLTAAGEVLLGYARQALSSLEEARAAIGDLQVGARGQLSLGAGVTTSIFYLPKLLRQFRKLYPAVDVVVRTGGSAEVASLVLDREVDLGIVTSPIEDQRLRVVELYREEIALVAPPTHPLASRAIGAEGLREAALILFPASSGFRRYLDESLARAGVAPQVKMESDSVEAIKSFVMVGLGLSFLPLSAVEQEIGQGALKRVPIRGMAPLRRQTSLIRRRDRHLSAPVLDFLRIARGKERGAPRRETTD